MNYTSHLLKTNEFAKLCNINKKTLIYYHQIGLFEPCHIDTNGYRYYSYHQYDTFSLIHALKEIGMPLKDIKSFIDKRNPERLVDVLTTQQQHLEEHIRKLQHTYQMLDTVIKITQKATSSDTSSISLLELDEEYLTLSKPITQHDEKSFFGLLSDHLQYCLQNQIEEGHPIGALLSKDCLLNHQFTHINYLFTKSVTYRETPHSFIKPKGLYAVSFHLGSYDTTPNTYLRLIAFIKENNLEICGNSYEETLLDYLSYSDSNQYLTQISIQVRPF